MNIKTGNFYKTKDGHKAYVHCKNEDFELYIGLVDGYSVLFKWDMDGKSIDDVSDFDIIEEWK